MHDGTNQKIISLQLFECGCCVNDFGRAIKYHKNDWRKFGALCVLIKHRDIGYKFTKQEFLTFLNSKYR